MGGGHGKHGAGATISQHFYDVSIQAVIVSPLKSVCTIYVNPNWSEFVQCSNVIDSHGYTSPLYMSRTRTRSSKASFTVISVVVERETASSLVWNQATCFIGFLDGESLIFNNVIPASFPSRRYNSTEITEVSQCVSLASELLFNMQRELDRMTLQFAAEIHRVLPRMTF